MGERGCQSPLENHPSLTDSMYLGQTDAYVLWSEDRDNHFLPLFLAPCFKLVFLKENVISTVGDRWAGLSSPAGIPVRENKNKNKVTLHTDIRTAGVLLCMNYDGHCLPSFLRRAWPRQAGRSSRVNGRALNFSSSNPDLEELRSCVTDPCFLWPVQSSLGLALQQSHAFSAV